ncbi:TetR family transcriptional regulator [Bdellovibrionota bacterium FG-1]
MSHDDTRNRLIEAATRLFSERGFDGTSVKELAEAAGVNVSLISYHFGGKENLYRTCLEQFGRARLAVAERVLQAPQSPEEFQLRLKLFVEEMFGAHLEDSQLARILHRECDLEMPIAQDIFRNTFLKVFETLVQFMVTAQKSGILKPELDAQIAASAIFGSLVHFMRMDRISEKFFGKTIKNKTYRQSVTEHFLEIHLHGLFQKRSSL